MVIVGCGGGKGPSQSSGEAAGIVGQTFTVSVYLPVNGKVTSPDGTTINCGLGGTACTASFPWNTSIGLTATAASGYEFTMWFGDCQNTDPLCTLTGGTGNGADRYIVALFDVAGQPSGHPNWINPAVHGLEFKKWVDSKDGAPTPLYKFDCSKCHGADFNGLGLAPSCTQCHATNGHPTWQSECTFCHKAPPQGSPYLTDGSFNPDYASPSNLSTAHPTLAVGYPITGCNGCHKTTVDTSGNIILGGTHMNGNVEAAGHSVPYPVAQHGPAFIAEVAASGGTTTSCQGCHGNDYGTDPGNNKVCNTCHATQIAAWPAGGSAVSATDWKSNCTFCHGDRTPNYAAADLGYAAPPDTIQGRLAGTPAAQQPAATVGRHQEHMFNGNLVAQPAPCATCHTQPSPANVFGHINNAPVNLTLAPNFPNLDPLDLANRNPFGTYTPPTATVPTGTCTVYCHGANLEGGADSLWTWSNDPAWSNPVGLACGNCHGQPPKSGALHTDAVARTYCTALAYPQGCDSHTLHARAMSASSYDSCAACHWGSANPQNLTYLGRHINGKADIVFMPAGTPRPGGGSYATITASFQLNGTVAAPVRTCTSSCHTTSGTTTTHTW